MEPGTAIPRPRMHACMPLSKVKFHKAEPGEGWSVLDGEFPVSGVCTSMLSRAPQEKRPGPAVQPFPGQEG